MTTNARGFSIVEVLVAIIILTIGILALAQSSGAVTTMIGRGKQDTQASAAAQQQLERLRQLGISAADCANLPAGSGSAPGPAPGTTSSWIVTESGPNNRTRDVVVTVTYRIARGTRSEVVRSVLECT